MDVEDKYYYENMSELTGVEIPWRIPADIHGQRVSRDEKRVRKVEDAMNSVKMKGMVSSIRDSRILP